MRARVHRWERGELHDPKAFGHPAGFGVCKRVDALDVLRKVAYNRAELSTKPRTSARRTPTRTLRCARSKPRVRRPVVCTAVRAVQCRAPHDTVGACARCRRSYEYAAVTKGRSRALHAHLRSRARPRTRCYRGGRGAARMLHPCNTPAQSKGRSIVFDPRGTVSHTLLLGSDTAALRITVPSQCRYYRILAYRVLRERHEFVLPWRVLDAHLTHAMIIRKILRPTCRLRAQALKAQQHSSAPSAVLLCLSRSRRHSFSNRRLKARAAVAQCKAARRTRSNCERNRASLDQKRRMSGMSKST